MNQSQGVPVTNRRSSPFRRRVIAPEPYHTYQDNRGRYINIASVDVEWTEPPTITVSYQCGYVERTISISKWLAWFIDSELRLVTQGS